MKYGDLISRQAAIDALMEMVYLVDGYYFENVEVIDKDDAIETITALPSAQPDFDERCTDCKEYDKEKHCCSRFNRVIREALKDVKPKQYAKEELKIFLHGLSLRLLSLRSAQHWQEDEETAKEIEFLAHLYEKVEADMKGKT